MGGLVQRQRTRRLRARNIRNFVAAWSFVDREDIHAAAGCGPDAKRDLELAQGFVDEGFDRLALMNSYFDVEGFVPFLRERALLLRSRAHDFRAALSGIE